jgi:hypothetical protein
MSNLIQISGKSLGELNHVAYCERCVWIKLRLQNRLPYQVFPGIFSSIDAYTKRVVENQLRGSGLPRWLAGLGDIVDLRPPPPYQEFQTEDPRHGHPAYGCCRRHPGEVKWLVSDRRLQDLEIHERPGHASPDL